MIILAVLIAFLIAWPLIVASEKRGDSDAWDHPVEPDQYESWK